MIDELKRIKEYIASAKRDTALRLHKLEVNAAAMRRIRKDLKLGPDDPVVVDGVPVFELSLREELVAAAIAYTDIRWDIFLPMNDAKSMLKAVPDEEMMGLIPSIIDTHMEELGIKDPVASLSASDVDDMEDTLKELGFEDVKI